ncbi:MAG: helix-turn-helix domain-containing protein [Burkholderiales bacterium]|nr:helix-turn-helix domain-containing protein [Burkholderiales bacterium]
MAQKTSPLLPATEDHLHRFGERLRLARRRRRLSSKQVAERAGMAPMTLRSLERGGSGVTIGAYLAVMQVLGLERDLDLLGQADPLGRELQDARLPAGRTAVASSKVGITQQAELGGRNAMDTPPEPVKRAVRHVDTLARSVRPRAKPAGEASAWMDDSGFTSSRILADLIEPTTPVPKKRRG